MNRDWGKKFVVTCGICGSLFIAFSVCLNKNCPNHADVPVRISQNGGAWIEPEQAVGTASLPSPSQVNIDELVNLEGGDKDG